MIRKLEFHAAGLCASLLALGAAHAESVYFKDVRLFDGTRTHEKTSVLVTDGLVAGVDVKAPPAGAQIIDGTGKTLIPGLIDAHVHSMAPLSQREALRFGVTTELDMFADASLLATFKRERASLAATDRADVFSAGTLVTAPGGHGTQFGPRIPTLTPDASPSDFVTARVREGSDFIKIVVEDGSAYGGALRFNSLAPGAVGAAITAAQQHGKLAVVHVSAQSAATQVLRAGADGLAHIFHDSIASDEFVKLAREREAFVVATLSVIGSVSGQGTGNALLQDAALAPYVLASQSSALKGSYGNLPNAQQHLSNAVATVRKLHAAGVRVLAGTDAPNPGTTHGVSMHGELALLVSAGMTPAEALAAATSAPATVFKLDDRGVIAAGKRADLVLLDGNPLANIEDTRRIAGIWKNGAALERAPTPAAKPATQKPQVVPVISDFDDGKLSAVYGTWQMTTDAMRGGASKAQTELVDGGPGGAGKHLRVRGTVAEQGAVLWSGVMFMPGARPFDPVDYSQRNELVFAARSDGRRYQVMLFTGETMQPVPSMQWFATTTGWQTVRVPLKQFSGSDLSNVRGIALVAAAPPGAFQLDLDDFNVE